MLYFDADPRDGAPAGGVCNTCCCQSLMMRPGETNLITINYAPWALPIFPPGIFEGTQFAFELDASACANNEIEGFGYPTNTNYSLTGPINNDVTIHLSGNAVPSTNTFTYALVPMQLPTHGQLQQTGAAGGPTFTYTPNEGFAGYDYFTYEMTDGQGRSIVRTVELNIGQHFQPRDRGRMSLTPFVDQSKVNLNRTAQTISFAMYMPLSVRKCEVYRMTVKQPAKDCDNNTYHHFSCYDIRCGECG